MTEFWILALVPALAWLLARFRSQRLLAEAEEMLVNSDRVSAQEIGELVKELSPSLRPSARVPAPNLSPESNHIWDSPTGKRVYIN